MTFKDAVFVVWALFTVVLIWVNAWLIDRLEAERRACRHQCPLVETVQAQLRSLCYAWGELDRAAQAKRKAAPEYSMEAVDKALDILKEIPVILPFDREW